MCTRIAAWVVMMSQLGMTACNAECTGFCDQEAMVIRGSNLVTATDTCGQTATCATATPCAALLLPPPPQGGLCTVTITTMSGGPIVANANWGAGHDTPCCGVQYESPPMLLLDAGTNAAGD